MSDPIVALSMLAIFLFIILLGFPVAFTLAGVGLGTAGVAWAFGIFDFSFLSAVPMVLTIWPGLFAGMYLLNRHRITKDSQDSALVSNEELDHEKHDG